MKVSRACTCKNSLSLFPIPSFAPQENYKLSPTVISIHLFSRSAPLCSPSQAAFSPEVCPCVWCERSHHRNPVPGCLSSLHSLHQWAPSALPSGLGPALWVIFSLSSLIAPLDLAVFASSSSSQDSDTCSPLHFAQRSTPTIPCWVLVLRTPAWTWTHGFAFTEQPVCITGNLTSKSHGRILVVASTPWVCVWVCNYPSC